MSLSTTQADQASSSNGQPGTTAKRTRLMRIIGRSLLGVIVLMGLAIVICWLIVSPKKPIFTLVSAQVTLHTLTDRKLNASIAFTIKSFNPNKRAAIQIEFMTMIVDEMGQKFQTFIPTFSQTSGNWTFLTPTVVVNIVDPFGRMKDKAESKGINPKLRFSGEISYVLNRWTSKRRLLEIYCDYDLRLKVNGSTLFDNTDCKVDL